MGALEDGLCVALTKLKVKSEYSPEPNRNNNLFHWDAQVFDAGARDHARRMSAGLEQNGEVTNNSLRP